MSHHLEYLKTAAGAALIILVSAVGLLAMGYYYIELYVWIRNTYSNTVAIIAFLALLFVTITVIFYLKMAYDKRQNRGDS